MKKKSLIVKESNTLARAKIDPRTTSIWDERVISTVIAQNRSDDTVFQEHLIPVTEMTGGHPLSTLQFAELRKAVQDRIVRQAFIIPQGRRAFAAVPIFKYIEVDEAGNIRACLNSELRKHFLDLKEQFALRKLDGFTALTGRYSQSLFRYLNSLKNTKTGEVTIELVKLHDILGSTPSLKKDFRNFRLRVLEPAFAEITDPEKTGLWFEWEPVKEGLQKVVAIRFIFDSTNPHFTPAHKARKDYDEMRQKANDCYRSIYNNGEKKCRPRKTSKQCDWCQKNGLRMVENYQKTNQLQLPLGDEPIAPPTTQYPTSAPEPVTEHIKSVPVTTAATKTKKGPGNGEQPKFLGIPLEPETEYTEKILGLNVPPDAEILNHEGVVKTLKALEEAINNVRETVKKAAQDLATTKKQKSTKGKVPAQAPNL